MEALLKLSDAFEQPQEDPGVELKVRMLNINFGHNKELMEKCHRLWEYSYFVEQVNQGIRDGLGMRKAANYAVEHCIDSGILSDILTENRMEVIGMLLCECDMRKVMKLWKQESMEDGREQGIKAMIEYGQELGADRERTLKQLILKFSMTPQKAGEYMEKYWK